MNVENRLKDLAVSDSGFLFDPYSGSTFTVNQTGRVIFDGLKDGSGREQIIADLEKAFDTTDDDDLQRDLDEFIHMLRQSGLLPEDFAIQGGL